MLSYQPQGRCTLRCVAASLRPSLFSRATICLTSCVRSLRATSTASGVSTTTMSSTPMHATIRPSAITRLPLVSCSITSPRVALPAPSFGCHLPQRIPGADIRPAAGHRHHVRGDAQRRCRRAAFPSPRSRSNPPGRRRTAPCRRAGNRRRAIPSPAPPCRPPGCRAGRWPMAFSHTEARIMNRPLFHKYSPLAR